MHMHRQLPLSSLLALRHAVELQPDSAHAYSELGVVAFDQLLFGDATTMSQMAYSIEAVCSSFYIRHTWRYGGIKTIEIEGYIYWAPRENIFYLIHHVC